MADVRVKVIGEDKASGEIKKVDKAMDKLNDVVKNATGLNVKELLSITALGMGFKALVDFTKESLDVTVKYAEQVRDLSRKLGISAEEASKLIQVSDDLKVEMGTLTGAFRFALQQGITPNVEGLIAMSEQYQAITDPAERARFAMERFGRQGLEMQKILEQTPEALQAMVDGLEGSSLVLSQDAVDAAREYEIALDTLQDEWQAFKVQLGNEIIPVVTRLIDEMNGAAQHSRDFGAAQERVNGLMRSGSLTFDQQARIMAVLGDTTLTTEQILSVYNSVLDETIAGAQQLYPEEERLTEIWRAQNGILPELTLSTEELALQQEELQGQLRELQSLVDGQLGPSIEDYTETQRGLSDEMASTRDRIAELQGLEWTPEIGEELAGLEGDLQDLAGEYANNAAAHEEATKRILFDLITQRAAMDGLTSDEITLITNIAESWGLIDEATATATQAADQAFIDLANGEGIGAVQSDLNYIYGQLGLINGYTATVTIRVTGDEIPSLPASQSGQSGIGYAKGGDFIVPPGYPSDTFMMGVTSGERVMVIPQGKPGNTTNNFSMTVHTNAPSSTVKGDFNTMKAMAGA